MEKDEFPSISASPTLLLVADVEETVLFLQKVRTRLSANQLQQTHDVKFVSTRTYILVHRAVGSNLNLDRMPEQDSRRDMI